jgi:hypothetical protein
MAFYMSSIDYCMFCIALFWLLGPPSTGYRRRILSTVSEEWSLPNFRDMLLTVVNSDWRFVAALKAKYVSDR